MDEQTHMDKFRARITSIKEREIPLEDVAESILDDYRAAAGHLINAALAQKDLHQQNFDKLVRFLKEHPVLEHASEIRTLYDELKTIRASRVYGSKKNGEALKRSEEILDKLKILCGYHDT
ncbi:MAG: hypothetical protein QMC77_07180 [Methanocellales archaeon]|nr:hypothetical protein [Methanocellales archaeon]